MNRYLAAPLLLLGYGLVRLVDGLDGSHGPGPAWTIGHLLFLAALVGFGAVTLDLRRRIGSLPALLTTVAVGLGLLAFAKVVIVDLIVGFGAADRAEMNLRYRDYETPADPALDFVGMLFPLGLVVLLALLAVAGRTAWWSPLLALGGFVVLTIELDLLPLGALLLLGALFTASRPSTPRVEPVGAGKAV
ncbi:hypothetical protein [Cryptosporangium aurantiacum]|uniref:Uncharacterized protein n=1 Tax=Cryptosporangium aurantiacum TaxID=134849 RepID=A0A1M7TVE6_9ACTN|nr:hypothetical protein [Cryptosporangium aurantiacum]SHN74712.1 hypothetical protein SAMN05443668_107135 [Cryptosporangium aurantiacum]